VLPAWLPRSAWSCVAQRFAFGLELGYALIQWPIGDVIARESEFTAPKAVDIGLINAAWPDDEFAARVVDGVLLGLAAR